jgi:hypothetical protein
MGESVGEAGEAVGEAIIPPAVEAAVMPEATEVRVGARGGGVPREADTPPPPPPPPIPAAARALAIATPISAAEGVATGAAGGGRTVAIAAATSAAEGVRACPLPRFHLLQHVNAKRDSIYSKTRQ